jgi:hypothetical protein
MVRRSLEVYPIDLKAIYPLYPMKQLSKKVRKEEGISKD